MRFCAPHTVISVYGTQRSFQSFLGQARSSRHHPMSPTVRSIRDPRVDFFRGVALLCIFVDHIPGNFFANFTLTNFGFADAAEIFVVLAGYAGFRAYSEPFKKHDWRTGLAKIGGRIRDLYLAHMLVLCVCVAGLAVAAWLFHNPLYFEHVNLNPLIFDPVGSIGRALFLVYQPGYLNILPLYVVLLAWLPVLLWLMRINLAMALLASAAIWVASGVLRYNLPSYTDAGGWIFDPFAWQFLFSLGAVSADATSSGIMRPQSRWLFWLATAYLLFGLLVAAPWTHLPGLGEARLLPDFRTSVSKQYLSTWRMVHIVAFAYVVASMVPPDARWMKSTWARILINCGQHSLPIFSLSIVLSLLGFVVLVQGGNGWLWQIAVNAIGAAVLGAVAWKLAQIRRARRRQQSAT